MAKYIMATLAFLLAWFAGATLYIAINGFTLVYGADTGAMIAFLWVASLVAAFGGYTAFRGEEE